MITEKTLEIILSYIEMALHDLGRIGRRFDFELPDYKLSCYLVGSVMRIDIKPVDQS